MTTTYSPRIYVASLSDYNAGVLHGVWIDAAQDADDIREEIAAMLRESKHPNVEVDCPDCTDDHPDPDVPSTNECTTCKGKGVVPSAEEYAIHDSEDWGGIKISEHESIDTIAELAEALEEHGEPWAKWWDNQNRDGADVEGFQDAYRGTFEDLEDYAYDFCDGIGMFSDCNETVKSYFDYERFGRDMELGGDIWTADGGDGIYVYNNH